MQPLRTFGRFTVYCVLLFTALAAHGDTQYFLYDELGRLNLATLPDGSAIAYIYDENGNRTAVLQWGTPTPVISSFEPPAGQAGVTVTIHGTGFSTTPAENAVTFDGVAASVTGASETTLTALVPLGAETGPIGVSTGGAGSSSVEDFVVFVPSITGFSPTIANPLNNITIEGHSLYLVPGMTSVTVGSTGVTELSIDNEEIVFDAPNTSGPITVTTPYGSDVSAGTLIVVPSAINASSVWDAAEVALNESASLSIGQQSAYGVFVFEGIQDQWLRVRLTALQTTPSGQVVNWVAYSPSGSSIASGTLTTSTLSPIYLPQIATTGLHVISFRSTTSSQVTLTGVVEPYPELSTSGTTVSAQTTVANEDIEFTFVASAGDDLSLAVTDIAVSTGPGINFRVYRPSGSVLEDDYCVASSNPGCSMELRNVTQNGTYRVVVSGYSASATMSVDLTLTENIVGGELTIDTPASVSIPIVGQRAEYTFTATAGQTFVMNLSSIVTSPSGNLIYRRVYGPTGTLIDQGTSTTLNLHDLEAGTHTIVLAPLEAATATLSLLVASGLDEEIEADGSSQAFATTVTDQDAYFTFDATAGDDLNFAVTGFSINPGSSATAYVFRPSGSSWLNQNISEGSNPGVSAELKNASQTGTYWVRVDPFSNVGIMNFTVTLSHNLNAGTLVINTPTAVNIAAYGQRAEASFTATASQNISLQVTGISTTPSGRSVNVKVFNPSGNQIATASPTSSTTINLTNLAAGTYSILLTPANAAKASLNLEID